MCTQEYERRHPDGREYDPVTGLYSMFCMLGLMEDYRQKEREADSYKTAYVLYFNVNKFKLYNNYYGLQAGNACLKEIGSILKEIFNTDLVSRFADDHFVVLYEGEDVTARIRAAHDCIEHINDNFRLRITAGIYQLERDVPANIACDYAKIACDEVRGNLTNYYCEYTATLQENLKLRKYILDNVDKAIENGWIQIYYQPVVRTLTQKLCSMEALTRWIDPQYGFLSPGVFIPVLERNNLIYKLDLFVIREVARHMGELKRAARQVMPVSINLSRMDFTVFNPCDELNKQVVKYELLREWINIEITESTMMVDPERIRQEIDRFHASGFQVWMDDFGSGYSSLNCLKDFDFDEIKIDLGFLRGMNDRAKRILKAIISMAKDLGIHTLAEGVETREQFNFLRNLGCERIQGYYFGRPEPYEDMKKHLNQQGVFPETRLQRVFFDKIGHIDFTTDQAMELLYYSQGKVHTLYMNEAYQKQRFGDVTDNFFEIDRRREDDISATYRSILRLIQNTIEEGHVDSADMVYKGRYYRVTMQLLNQDKNGCVLISTSTDITHDEESKERTRTYDRVVRQILEAYDEVYLLDYTHDKVRIISSKLYAHDLVGEDLPAMSLLKENFIKQNIYYQDQQIFREFLDRETITHRLRESHRASLGQFVRVRNQEGGYQWASIGLVAPPSTSVDVAILGIWSSSFLMSDKKALQFVDRLMGTDLSHNLEQQGFMRLASFWRTLMQQTKIKFFWKDKQRRFLGVSQAFLDFYHFSSPADVIGKTDEEVGFHIADDDFRRNEERVLQKGLVVQNAFGKNIVNGIEQNIVNSKFPVYENGRIVGLIGYFFDVDNMFPQFSQLYRTATLDKVTGFMNMAGFFETLSLYDDQWRLDKNEFSLSLLEIPAYDDMYQTYSKEVAEALMHEVGTKISQAFGHDHIIARISGRKFALLKRAKGYVTLFDLKKQLYQCAKQIEAIHEVDGYSCTVFVYCGTVMSHEAHSIFDLITLADRRLTPVRALTTEGASDD